MFKIKRNENACRPLSKQASPQITPVLEGIQSDEGQEVLEQAGSEPTESQPHTSTPSIPGDDEIECQWASWELIDRWYEVTALETHLLFNYP